MASPQSSFDECKAKFRALRPDNQMAFLMHLLRTCPEVIEEVLIEERPNEEAFEACLQALAHHVANVPPFSTLGEALECTAQRVLVLFPLFPE